MRVAPIRQRVIAALISAGRPDLANHVAHGAVGYWEQQYRKLLLPARDLQRQVEFWHKQAQKSNEVLARSLGNAAKRLEQFQQDILPLRKGLGDPLSPHEVPRLRNVS